MFESQLRVYAFSLAYLEKVVRDLPDDALGEPAGPGVNPPAWILGHLACATDWALQILGKSTLCPPDWHKQFSPGSDPAKIARPHPSKDEFMSAIRRGHEAVTAAAPDADPARMTLPHGNAFLQNTPVQTLGDALTLLLTVHEGIHIGQLSLCRRLRGKPHLF